MMALSPRKLTVFAERVDRLTSRLEGLLSVWRFARSLERNTVLFWPPRRDDAYLSATIFDLAAMAQDPASSDLTLIDEKYAPRENVLDLGTTPDWPDRLQRQNVREIPTDIFVRSQSDIQYQKEKPSQIAAEKKLLYERLRPHPLILERLSEALAWIGPGDFIAVHIRRGDLIENIDLKMRRYESRARPKAKVYPAGELERAEERLKGSIHQFILRAAPLEAYRDALRFTTMLRRKNSRVIIFSDTESCAREFQEKCRDHPSVLMSEFKTELSEIQRAYLEMLILCRARRIISTRSTYGKFAAFYGDTAFTDVRWFTTREKMRFFFRQNFSSLWQDRPELRAKCEQLLDLCLGRSKVVKFFMAIGRSR